MTPEAEVPFLPCLRFWTRNDILPCIHQVPWHRHNERGGENHSKPCTGWASLEADISPAHHNLFRFSISPDLRISLRSAKSYKVQSQQSMAAGNTTKTEGTTRAQGPYCCEAAPSIHADCSSSTTPYPLHTRTRTNAGYNPSTGRAGQLFNRHHTH